MLRTKLLIPYSSSRNLVERPELFGLLHEGLKVKLTAVIAPAGYGKTTSLSSWARKYAGQVTWVSLDIYDNELMSFWGYIVDALQEVYSDIGNKLTKQFANVHNAYRIFIDALLNQLMEVNTEVVLILDDFHVIDDPVIRDSFAYFMEYLPSHIHIFIAARSSLPFPSARLLAKGELQFITVQDLRFQLHDGIRYFQDCMNIELSSEETELFVRRTEGWISGLHLAALSLKNSVNPTAFIRDFGGNQTDITQYLMEEVLAKQPDEMRSFLIQTSVLSKMNAALCDTVTGLTNAHFMLERLDHQNLFIVKLDERGEWYRYHHLFADFLQRQFQRIMPRQCEESHVKAAQWLEANGDLVSAVEHWLSCGRHAEAAALIEHRLNDLQDHRNALLRWLRELPEPILRRKPFLQLLYLKICCEEGQYHWVKDQLLQLETEFSELEWKPWIGSHYFISAEAALYSGDVSRSLECIELFNQHEPPGMGSPLLMIASNTLAGISFESLLSFYNSFHEAESFMLRCIEIWEEKGNFAHLGYFYYTYMELLYEWNRIDEAESIANRMHTSSQWKPYARIWFHVIKYLALIKLMKGETKSSFFLMEQMKDQFNTMEEELYLRRLAAEEVYLSILAGATNEVGTWIENCGLRYNDPIPFIYREYYVLARALIEVGQTSEALILLENLSHMTEQKKWLWDQVKVMILQSIAIDRQGVEEEALLKLEKALYLAEPQSFMRSFLDEQKALGDLLLRYLRRRQARSSVLFLPVSLQYVKRLLKQMNVQWEESLLARSILTDQEIKILYLVEQGLKNREVAEQLGVTSETVKKHMKNISLKLQAKNRVQAVKAAKDLRLI